MLPRSSIFDSRSEHDLFAALQGAWEPDYRLYPHVPFANLINLDPHLLRAEELSFLHKTTVDFVLTSAPGRPLLGIEFDGLGQGYSHDGKYIQVVESKRDPSRTWKLGLKTRVANEALFPFLVISYDEKVVIDEETNLTVAHAIVGSFLSAQYLGSRVQELVEEAKEWLAELSPDDREEQIQDIMLGAEIDADVTWNPVTRRALELGTRLYRLDSSARQSYSYCEDPPRPDNAYPHQSNFDLGAFQKWWREIKRLGCQYQIITRAGTVARTVWVRNFAGPFLTPFGFLDEIAAIVACKAAIALLEGFQD